MRMRCVCSHQVVTQFTTVPDESRVTLLALRVCTDVQGFLPMLLPPFARCPCAGTGGLSMHTMMLISLRSSSGGAMAGVARL